MVGGGEGVALEFCIIPGRSSVLQELGEKVPEVGQARWGATGADLNAHG